MPGYSNVLETTETGTLDRPGEGQKYCVGGGQGGDSQQMTLGEDPRRTEIHHAGVQVEAWSVQHFWDGSVLEMCQEPYGAQFGWNSEGW